jgi:hypothetical protein
MEKEMHVGINQTREQSAIPEIDGFCAGGVGHLCAYFHDAFALDQYLTGLRDSSAFDVEQTRSM